MWVLSEEGYYDIYQPSPLEQNYKNINFTHMVTNHNPLHNQFCCNILIWFNGCFRKWNKQPKSREKKARSSSKFPEENAASRYVHPPLLFISNVKAVKYENDRRKTSLQKWSWSSMILLFWKSYQYLYTSKLNFTCGFFSHTDNTSSISNKEIPEIVELLCTFYAPVATLRVFKMA